MASICTEQQHHKFHRSHQLNLKQKILREIDIPPRRLLNRRHHLDSDLFFDSDESLLRKFLPCNNLDDDDDDDADPYSADQFRIYEFKVRKCTRSRSHDWTDCPFAHPGEKARRRDPRRYHYSGTVCPEFRRGSCTRGENCEFSHGVFECWLHPSRYRTEACKDGKNCKRKICFFAHTPRQLRVLPVNCNETIPTSMLNSSPRQSCCIYCHSVTTNSPTSTLLGMSHMSPPLSPSPPRSPAKPAARFSPVSRYKDKLCNMESGGFLNQFNSGGIRYNDAVINELMNSMEAMQLHHQEPTNSQVHAAAAVAKPWLDVNFNGEDQFPNQFIMSPSHPSGSSTRRTSSKKIVEETDQNNGLAGPGPDLGWVNDLLT